MRLVVVQVNATGDDPARHVALEVAAVSLGSEKRWDLTVPLTPEQLADADPSVLRRNGYYRRGLADRADLTRSVLSARIADLAGGFGWQHPRWDVPRKTLPIFSPDYSVASISSHDGTHVWQASEH